MDEIRELSAVVRGERESSLAWPRIVELARVHGVLPLVAWRALAAGSAGASPSRDVAAELQRVRYEKLAIAIVQEREVAGLAERLRAAGIEALVFKGQVLSVEAYGEIGLREPGDVDVLVRPSDAERTARDLRDDGYEFLMGLSEIEWRRVRSNQGSWGLRKGEMVVDLHWEPFSAATAFPIPADELLDDAREVSSVEARIPTMSLDHLVLFLAIHGAKHFWSRLEWLVSFDAIAAKEGIDWTRVRALARRYGGERRLDQALRLRETWELPPSPAGRWTALATEARQLDRRRDMVRTAAIALFSPRLPDWRWLRLPRGLGWLYPLVRVVRLVAER